ncbi:MAG: hypothetical protein MH252_13540 [Thermosynechococcaceae cyanobacterium MS004]|nr:hypothetical protein [Thermosynechococcaceae cyanobacterium MS004]
MKTWTRNFSRLFLADQPQERSLSVMIVVLAIAYVGLTWNAGATSCTEAGVRTAPVSLQPLICD